jgi:hypothetical protein
MHTRPHALASFTLLHFTNNDIRGHPFTKYCFLDLTASPPRAVTQSYLTVTLCLQQTSSFPQNSPYFDHLLVNERITLDQWHTSFGPRVFWLSIVSYVTRAAFSKTQYYYPEYVMS